MITPDYDPRFLDTYIEGVASETMDKILMRLLDMGYEYINKDTKEYLLTNDAGIHVDHYGYINVLTGSVKEKKMARAIHAYDVLEADILPYIPRNTVDLIKGTPISVGTMTLVKFKESSSWKVTFAKAYRKYSTGTKGKIFAYDNLKAVKQRLKADGYDISAINDGSLCLRLGDDMKVRNYASIQDFMASSEPLLDIDDIGLPILSKGSTVIVKDNAYEDFRIDFFEGMAKLPDGTFGFGCKYTGTHRYCLPLQGNEDKLKKR